MSIINNMLKDLEKRNNTESQKELDNSNIRIAEDPKTSFFSYKIILMMLFILSLVFAIWIFLNDNDFLKDIVYGSSEPSNEQEVIIAPIQKVVTPPAKKIIKPQPIEQKNQTEAIEIKTAKLPKIKPLALTPETSILKTSTDPISKTKKPVNIQNVRYFSDRITARIVVDSIKDISKNVSITHNENNQVLFEFDSKGILNQTIDNNYSDDVIKDFKIKEKNGKTIISYRTLVKSSSKYHQLAPETKPFYRFVIIIRPKNYQPKTAKPDITSEPKTTTKETQQFLSVKLLNKKKLDANKWFRLAQAQYKKGQLSKAKDNLKKLLINDPHHIEGYHLLANIYLQYGHTIDAKKVLKDGLQQTKSTKIGVFYAQLLAESEQTQKALEVLEELNQEQNTIELLSLKGALLQQTKQHTQAINTYLKLLEQNEDVGKWWMALAISLEAKNKISQAKNAYEQATLKPDMTPALLEYAKKRLRGL